MSEETGEELKASISRHPSSIRDNPRKLPEFFLTVPMSVKETLAGEDRILGLEDDDHLLEDGEVIDLETGKPLNL